MRIRRVVSSKKKEKIDPHDRLCTKCQHAYLMREYEGDPIISECGKTKERFVASFPHFNDCGFTKNESEMVIHEMIYLR